MTRVQVRTKGIVATCLVLLSASRCFASGWNDFELDLGDGYKLVRCNTTDIRIWDPNGLLLCPRASDGGVGPVVGYIVTPKHILAKTWGRTRRNLFEGDTYEQPDSAHEFFYVIPKGSGAVIGPLAEQDFAKRPEVIGLKSLDWKIPENPHPQPAPLSFWIMASVAVAVRYGWPIIPVILGAIILIAHVRRARRRKT
jgi:hypothetical protein